MVESSHRSFRRGVVDAGAQGRSRLGRPGTAALLLPTALAFLAADLLSVAGSFGVVLGISAGVGDLTAAGDPRSLLAAALVPPLFALAGLYRARIGDVEEARRIILGVAFLALVHLGLRFLPGLPHMPVWHLVAWPLVAGLALLGRTLLRDARGVRVVQPSHVIVLGSGGDAQALAAQLEENPSWPARVLRTAPMPAIHGRSPADVAALIGREARRAGVTPAEVEILLAPSPAEAEAAADLARALDRLGQPFASLLPLPRGTRPPQFLRVTGIDPVLVRRPGRGQDGAGRIAKRALDLAAGLFLVALLSPVLLVISLLVRRDGGSIFYVQTRVGRGGRRFGCFKFRSMYPDAEARLLGLLAEDPAARAEWQRHQKLANDPRVTRIGRFLRQTSLDELPQLFNVLRGEMSLVGPRPIVAPELPGYAGDHAYYHSPDFAHYAACTPGITGLWQVSGRATTTHDHRIRLDVWYASNWSVWLDIVILFRTLRVVLGGTGS